MESVKIPDQPPLIELLARALRLQSAELVERMADAGFDQTLAHSQVFGAMTLEGLRLTDLAARAGMTKQAMGELVDDLEVRGYLERVPDPSDGRAKIIRFTARGRDALAAAYRIFLGMEADLAARIGATRARDLRRALTVMVASGDERSHPGP